MDAAGILRDIAADRAGDLRGRIWRVIKATRLHSAGDRKIGDARFGDDAAILVIDVENPVHAAQTHQDRIGQRQGAAGERGARAARHDGDALLRRELQHGGDFVLGSGKNAGQRLLAIGGQRIAVEGGEPSFIRNHAIRHQRAQPGDDGIATGENVSIGCR